MGSPNTSLEKALSAKTFKFPGPVGNEAKRAVDQDPGAPLALEATSNFATEEVPPISDES